jgi:uncharacterized protein (TIGR03083 family)
VRHLVLAQRERLGNLIEGLDEAEWDRPSLCADWRVREVVAHCAQSHVATPWSLAVELSKARFRLVVRNERWVVARRRWPRSKVLAEYRSTAGRLDVPATELPFALVETVIHGYDIAWALNLSIDVPEESLVTVVDACRRTGLFLGGRQRSAGLTLRASDVDWSAGSGPEVIGPLAAIGMAIAGRPAALAALSGEGLDVLRSRL